MTAGAASTKRLCPHCGRPPGLRWYHLLPSNNRNRVLKCASCGGGYDLSDGAKIASMMGGFLGLGPSILLFGKIAKAGHGSAAATLTGTIVVAAAFALGSMLVASLALALVPKK
ncbi:MAG TPA: hypothetical protein VMT03_03795 [Polyangia bacterium]|nr:hypothetical protein [Polyangia bacterium]